jgi:hypothetical protein
LFIMLFLMIGIILSILVLNLIHRLNLIEKINKKEFSVMLLLICILTISGASLANRTTTILGHENSNNASEKVRLKGLLGFDYSFEKKTSN